MKIAVKEVGKELRITETDKKYRSDCAKEYIGERETVQFVLLSQDNTFSFGVNEDGLPLDLPLNFLISTTSSYFPIQKIVGTAVFVRTKYVNVWEEEIWDYEVEDLKEEDIAYIKKMLDGDYQKKLEKIFSDYGRGALIVEKIL